MTGGTAQAPGDGGGPAGLASLPSPDIVVSQNSAQSTPTATEDWYWLKVKVKEADNLAHPENLPLPVKIGQTIGLKSCVNPDLEEMRWSVAVAFDSRSGPTHVGTGRIRYTDRRGNKLTVPKWQEVFGFRVSKTQMANAQLSFTLVDHEESPKTSNATSNNVNEQITQTGGAQSTLVFSGSQPGLSPHPATSPTLSAGNGSARNPTNPAAGHSTGEAIGRGVLPLDTSFLSSTPFSKTVNLSPDGGGNDVTSYMRDGCRTGASGSTSVALFLEIAAFASTTRMGGSQMQQLSIEDVAYERDQCRLLSPAVAAYSHGRLHGAQAFAWSDEVFMGEFGDPFTRGHVRDDEGDLGYCIERFLATLSLATDPETKHASTAMPDLSRVLGPSASLKPLRSWLTLFRKDGNVDDVRRLSDVLKTSLQHAAEVDKKLREAAADSSGGKMEAFVSERGEEVEGMLPGQVTVWPGGWRHKGNQADRRRRLLFVIERTQPREFAFCACNAGQGVRYHPAARMLHKDKRFCAFRMEKIPEERLADRAFLWALFHYQHEAVSDKADGQILYELLLPQLAGQTLRRAAADMGYYPSDSGRREPHHACKPETIPRNGEGSQPYRSLLCAVRYLLLLRGFSLPQVKQALHLLRHAFLRRVTSDLLLLPPINAASSAAAAEDATAQAIDSKAKAPGFFASDRRMIELACHQLALSAVKQSRAHNAMDVGLLQAVKAEISIVQNLAARVHRLDGDALPDSSAALQPPLLSSLASPLSVTSNPPTFASVDTTGRARLSVEDVCAWHGLEVTLQTAGADLSEFEGEPQPVAQKDAVNHLQIPAAAPAVRSPAPEDCNGIAKTLKTMQKVAGEVRRGAEDRVGMLQIATQIEHVFLCLLPLPSFAAGSWQPSESRLRTELLGLLAWSSKEYSAVTRSVPLHRDMRAARAITHAAIMAGFFQVLRAQPQDLSAADAVLPELIAEEKMAFNAASPAGEPLCDVLSHARCLRPQHAEARAAMLQYAADMEAWSAGGTAAAGAAEGGGVKAGAYVFDMRFSAGYSDDTEVKLAKAKMDTDPLASFFSKLLKRFAAAVGDSSLGPDQKAPGLEVKKDKDGKEEEPNELVKLVHWLKLRPKENEQPQHWMLLRDMLVRFWIGVQYTRPNAGVVDKPLSTQQAEVSIDASFSDNNNIVKLKPSYGGKSFANKWKYPLSRADARFYLGKPEVWKDKPQAYEEDIIHWDKLVFFKHEMVEETAEELLSLLSAPSLRIPLLLQFLLNNREHLLLSPALRLCFSDSLFEAGPWTPHSAPPSPDVVPAPEPLATPRGTLVSELELAPESTLQPLLALLHKVAGLCIGGPRSRYVPTFLLLLRCAVRVHGFASHIVACPGAHPNASSDARKQLASLSSDLAKFLCERDPAAVARGKPSTAIDIVNRWIALEEEQESKKTRLLCALHLHRALTLLVVPEDTVTGPEVDAAVEAFMFSVTFVKKRFLDSNTEKEASDLAGVEDEVDEGGSEDADKAKKKRTDTQLDAAQEGCCEQELFWLLRSKHAWIDRWLKNASRSTIEAMLSRVTQVVTPVEWKLPSGQGEATPFGKQTDAVVKCETTVSEAGHGDVHFYFSVHACDLWKSNTSQVPIPRHFAIDPAFQKHCADMTQFCEHSVSAACETVKIVKLPPSTSPAEPRVETALLFQRWSELSKKEYVRARGNPEPLDRDDKNRPKVDSRYHFAGKLYGGKGREYIVNGSAGKQQRSSDKQPVDVVEAKWLEPILDPVLQGALSKAADLKAARLEFRKIGGSGPSAQNLRYLLPVEAVRPEASEVSLLCLQETSDLQFWKELRVSRHLSTVDVFAVDSFGRRGFLRQVYSSDARFALAALRPKPRDANRLAPVAFPLPSAIKHQAGEPLQAPVGGRDLMVTRRVRSIAPSGEERAAEHLFIPSEHFVGQLPEVLLENMDFWQVTKTQGSDLGSLSAACPRPDPFFRYRLEVCANTSTEKLPETVTALPIAEGAKAKESDEEVTPNQLQPEHSSSAEEGVSITRLPGSISVLRFDIGPEAGSAASGAQATASVAADRVVGSATDQVTAMPVKARALVNLKQIPQSSPYHDLVLLLTRLEDLSHILAWTPEFDASEGQRAPPSESKPPQPRVELFELPRLKLRFGVRFVGKEERGEERAGRGRRSSSRTGTLRLESRDRVGFFVLPDQRDLPADLVAGLPSSLVLADDAGSLVILLPNCPRAVRSVAACPLQSESVAVADDASWLAGCAEMRTFSYEVHPSKRFVLYPSLAAALYWTYAKLLHREYAQAFTAAGSCGTDMPLSEAELTVVRFFTGLNRLDPHPDAHGCRLRLRVALTHCPDLSDDRRLGAQSMDAILGRSEDEVRLYLSKLPHVSAACRLSREEEDALTGGGVCGSNRRLMLQHFGAPVEVQKANAPGMKRLQQHDGGGFWNDAVEEASEGEDPGNWESQLRVVAEGRTLKIKDAAECVRTCNVNSDKGYLFLLWLLAGRSKLEVGGVDSSRQFGELLVRLCLLKSCEFGRYGSDSLDRAFNPRPRRLLVASTIADAKELQTRLPTMNTQQLPETMYTYNAKEKHPSWWKADNSPVYSCDQRWDPFLFEFVNKHVAMVTEQAHRKRVSEGNWMGREELNREMPLEAEDATYLYQLRGSLDMSLYEGSLALAVSNYSCDQRVLRPFSHLHASLSPAHLLAYANKPLDAALEGGTKQFLRSRNAMKQCPKFPFPGIDGLIDDGDVVARENIARLQQAWDEYSRQVRKEEVHSIVGITPDLLQMAAGGGGARHCDNNGQEFLDLGEKVQKLLNKVAVPKLRSLLAALQDACRSDVDGLDMEIEGSLLFASSGSIAAGNQSVDNEAALEKQRVELQGLAGTKPSLSVEFLIAALVSDNDSDLKRVNPLLSKADITQLHNAAAAIVLRTIRIAQLRRAISTAITAVKEVQAQSVAAVVDVNQVKKETNNLSAELGSQRHILKEHAEPDARQAKKTRAAAEREKAFEFDPRYLLFEFLFGWLLSKKQVELVGRFHYRALGKKFAKARPATGKRGATSRNAEEEPEEERGEEKLQSMVHQMIMGAGKTTCIGPLLALILADRRSLVTQVVPNALLTMSRDVLWTRFTQIIPKRIFTLEFSRSTDISSSALSALWAKLEAARVHGDVVVTTPSSIKALINRFIERNRDLQLAGSEYAMEEEKRRPEIQSLEVEEKGLEEEMESLKEDADRAVVPESEKNEFKAAIEALEMAEKAVDEDLRKQRIELKEVEKEGEGLEKESEAAKKHAEKKSAKAKEVEAAQQKVRDASKAKEAKRRELKQREDNANQAASKLRDQTRKLDQVQKSLKELRGHRDVNQKDRSEIDRSCSLLAKVIDLWRNREGSSPATPASQATANDGNGTGNGVLILDEVDMLLHPLRSELNFPIGTVAEQKPILPNPHRWAFSMWIFEALFWARETTADAKLYSVWSGKLQDPPGGDSNERGYLHRLKDIIKQGLAQSHLQSEPHLVLLNEQWYHDEGSESTMGMSMKKCLALWAFDWMREEAQLFAHVSVPDDVVLDFLLHGVGPRSSPEAIKTLKQLAEQRPPSMPPDEHERLFQMLNLGHDILNSYVPHALSKVYRVSFGLLLEQDLKVLGKDTQSESRLLLAVPFVGKDTPSRAAEFAQPDVLIAMTILAYHYGGLRRPNLQQLLNRLKTDYSLEVGDPEKRESYVKFEGIVNHAIRTRLLEEDASLGGKAETAVREQWKLRHGEPPNLKQLAPTDPADVDQLLLLLQHSRPTAAEFLLTAAFPPTMRQQPLKISSSAQELGGGAVFGRRLGFSGTPSNLLPEGLGHCRFDKESEGRILRTLTDPAIVQQSPLSNELLDAHAAGRVGRGTPAGAPSTQLWSTRSILDSVASGSGNTKYHALIDTGALVTGLSNEQVARYLLEGTEHPGAQRPAGAERRLADFDACVFLDERDRKMVIKRGAARTFPLSEYGGSKERIFTFFDQVHTTGMDIKQALDARALLTIGKDMTFRDYAQGGYRMRGIGKGQTLHLFLVPEVKVLIDTKLKLRRLQHPPDEPQGDGERPTEGTAGVGNASAAGAAEKVVLEVVEWLLVNGLKTERLQYQQLQSQNLASVWRQRALQALLSAAGIPLQIPNPASGQPGLSLSVGSGLDRFKGEHAQQSLECWIDKVDTSLQQSIGAQQGVLDNLQKEHEAFARKFGKEPGAVLTAEQAAAVKTILERFRPKETDGAGGKGLSSEMTREREREAEDEEEKEVDEKDDFKPLTIPPPQPWPAALLSSLRASSSDPDAGAAPLSFCRPLTASTRTPSPFSAALAFPQQVLQTVNFGPAGGRVLDARPLRLKSVQAVLDWLPSPEDATSRLFVALSLAEAEAVRAILLANPALPAAVALLHLESDRVLASSQRYREAVSLRTHAPGVSAPGAGLGGPSVPRCLQVISGLADGEGEALFPDRRPSSGPNVERGELLLASGTAGACLRFFNCKMHLSEVDNLLVLKALTGCAGAEGGANQDPGARKQFFKEVLEARRARHSKRLIGHATVRWLFTYKHARELADVIKLRHEVLRRMRAKNLTLVDEFKRADRSNNGQITLEELEEYICSPDMCADVVPQEKVKNLLTYMDTDGTGIIDKREFVAMFEEAP